MWNVMEANIFCFPQCQASILITKDVSNTYSEQKMKKQNNKSSKDGGITFNI